MPHLEVQKFGPSTQSWQKWPEPIENESLEQALTRLFYNPRGNERLYIFSCVERLLNEIATSKTSAPDADWSSSVHYQALIERLYQNFPEGFRFRIQVCPPHGKKELVFLSADHGPREAMR